MTSEFKLPKNAGSSEKLGLHLLFQEVKVRGSDKTTYQVVVTEENEEIVVTDIHNFSSWDEMKKEYPTLKDFLLVLSQNEYWFSSWRSYNRIYFFASLTGHEGLYDTKTTVWFDAEKEFGNQ